MPVKRLVLSIAIVIGTLSAIGFVSAATWSNVPTDGTGNLNLASSTNVGSVLYVPSNFATAGCNSSSTLTDFGACVNSLYATANASSVAIMVPNITVSQAQWKTPINFNSNYEAPNFVCPGGATLKYGGSGAAVTFNFGNPTGHLVSQDYGCTYMGSSTLIAAAQTSNATTTGIAFGGGNGAVFVDFHDNNVNGFGHDVTTGANTYMFTFDNNAVSGGANNATGSLLYIAPASNSGERFVFNGDTFTDPANSSATNALYIDNNALADAFFTNDSFDDAVVTLGISEGTVNLDGDHFENASYSNYKQPYFIIASSSGATNLNVIGDTFALDNPGASGHIAEGIEHAVNLVFDDNIVDNYGGASAITNFIDHSLNPGQAVESIDGNWSQNNAVANWVNLSGTPYPGPIIEKENGYPFSYTVDGGGNVTFTAGNQTTAQIYVNGQWQFPLGVSTTQICLSGTCNTSWPGGSGGVSTSTANAWSQLQTFNGGLSAASITLPYTNASGTFSYSLKNDGNYLEINDTTGTIPGTSPVPYNIILQNCPPVSTTSTAVTSSSWECALSQAENFPDGSRSFVDWDTEYYPTGTNPNVASGWFDNKRGTSSVEFPFELSWNDGSVNHVGFSMTPASNLSASNFNTLVNNGTGYFTVGTASSTTGAFDVFQNGGNTCAGIYDAGANVIYGLTDSLPAPSGCVALGGYYHGLGIGGSTANAGSPIFGVLNSSQSSNGKGHTAFTVYDTNEVDTYNNTLDDGTGNAIVSSTLTAKNIKITSITSSLLATDANGNIIATTTAGGGGGGVASTTPFTTDAPVTVSSSGALSTYPNNPVPFYTYGVQYSQTTAAPQGVTTSVTLWGPFYWGAAAQCSSLTYDITTGGGAGSWVDFGIYDVNGNLLANTGPETLNTTGIKNYSFTQGREIITPQDVYVGIGVTSSSARFAAWAANYGWMQAGKGANLTNASATLPSLTTFPASSTVNNTVVPSFSCSY